MLRCINSRAQVEYPISFVCPIEISTHVPFIQEPLRVATHVEFVRLERALIIGVLQQRRQSVKPKRRLLICLEFLAQDQDLINRLSLDRLMRLTVSLDSQLVDDVHSGSPHVKFQSFLSNICWAASQRCFLLHPPFQ